MLKIVMIAVWILSGILAFLLGWMVAALAYLKWYFAKIPPGQRTLVIGRWFG
jgi:uncharacterized membrane protein